MERELRDLVARSHLSVAHAAALVQIDAAHGATEQARGLLDELVGTGLATLRPDMVYVWALTLLARGCVVLRAARHAPRIYRALAPYAGRAAVAAGRDGYTVTSSPAAPIPLTRHPSRTTPARRRAGSGLAIRPPSPAARLP